MAHHYTNDTRERSAHSVSSQRKRPRQQEPPSYNDILAFGYAALTFRNDELAGSIERGDYLIPWNGETEADTDDVIYLDRYDVRNLLHTRSELDSFSRPSTTPSVPTDLLEEERQCDEERYKDVDSDEEMIFDMSDDEREEYIEEKNKRKEMAEKGRVWKFDYGKSPGELNENNDTEESTKGIVIPSTTRLKEIVHRTAKFLLTQPPQMEITIQVKQSSNPDFNFLRKDDILHPYYKHVKWLMSSGMWEYQNEEENVSECKMDGEYDNGDVGRRREKGGVIKPDMDDRKRKRPQVEATSLMSKRPDDLPTDLSSIIEKTARFVAKNGILFESKLKQNNLNDERFAFLNPWNKWHGWYRTLVVELSNNTYNTGENELSETEVDRGNVKDHAEERTEIVRMNRDSMEAQIGLRRQEASQNDSLTQMGEFNIEEEIEKGLISVSSSVCSSLAAAPPRSVAVDSRSSNSNPSSSLAESAPMNESDSTTTSQKLNMKEKLALLRRKRELERSKSQSPSQSRQNDKGIVNQSNFGNKSTGSRMIGLVSYDSSSGDES